jgi:hypothetical protein
MIKTFKNNLAIFTFRFFEIEVAMTGFFLSSAFADGRSMDQAASSIVNSALTVGKAISVLGAIGAGIAYNVPGLEEKAQKYLRGFLMGTVCTFGASSYVKFIQGAF